MQSFVWLQKVTDILNKMGAGPCILGSEKLLIYKFFKYLEKLAKGEAVGVFLGESKRSLLLRLVQVTGKSLSSVQRIVHTGEEAALSSVPDEQEETEFKNAFVSRHNKNRPSPKTSVSVENLCSIRNIIYNFHTSDSHLVTLDSLRMKINNEIGLELSTTSLFRILHKVGFRFIKSQNNRVKLTEKPDIIEKRKSYLISVQQYLSENRPLVYVDETYIHTFTTSQKSWYDKTDQGFRSKIGKGSRFVIGNYSLKLSPLSYVQINYFLVHTGSENGFVKDSLLFCRSKGSVDDYHGEMNTELFTKWVEENLIPNLEPNTIVILDNASYHNAMVNRLPTFSSKKSAIIDFLIDKVI